MADCLSCLNFTVAEGVGGTGVAGVLDNGDGQYVMLRAEMDAHPIEEATGLPYACKKMSLDYVGDQRRVMHAAGHDLHMASLLAAATLMRHAVSHWRGTLVVVFQPNSVHGEGAEATVKAGLYEIAPVPHAIFGQHSGPLGAGDINIMDGPSLMSLDTVGIELRCSLGYQANPQCNANAVALASELLIALDRLADNNSTQAHTSLDRMILGRSAYPGQQGVDAIDLTVSVRTDDDSMRRRILEAIEPRVREVCASTGIQDPSWVLIKERAPVIVNDASLAGALRQSFSRHFGQDKVYSTGPVHSDSEDFPRLAAPHGTPYVMWHLGRQGPSAAGPSGHRDFFREVPLNGSPFNAPALSALSPTLQTGTDALALAALGLLRPSLSEEPIDT